MENIVPFHIRIALAGLVWLAISPAGVVIAQDDPPRDPAAAWKAIESSFKPPSEFAGQLGAYRSLLLFNDGTRVETAADWARRRKEIAETWNTLIGPWPPVLEKPKVEVLSQSQRDHFSQ